MNVSAVSVLLCTYNRARLLGETLSAMQAMAAPGGCRVEILVVDNNSNDGTAAVVAAAAAAGPYPIVPLRELRQGKSFGLNAALARAQGDVIALTDDDVLPNADWLQRIVHAFRTRPVTFVFGKVLPRWGHRPPPELLMPDAQAIWGPMAIVDYGDEPVDYLPGTQGRLPIGANLSFAREPLLATGGWRTDLGKVNNTLVSGEDHEIFVRLRRLGRYAGYYDPENIVRHYVPAERLTRRYFRRWFYWHGKTQALMLDDMYPELDMRRVPRVLGVPRFALRQAGQQARRWIASMVGRDALRTLIDELYTIEYAGLFVQCWQLRRRRPATTNRLTRVGVFRRFMGRQRVRV